MFWKEVVASLYPWDLLDEGLDNILDTLERDTLTNSTYLVALMHDEKRPLTDFYYPHNPQRKVYWTEDSRAYWKPNADSYADCRILPRVSDRPEIRERDWLQELIDGSRQRGMTVGAELSHTWIDKARMREELEDVRQRDIFGAAIDGHMCPNHPDVRAYGTALYLDLATHYDIDFIQTCMLGFYPGGRQPWAGSGAGEAMRLLNITTGGCFCQHCQASAEARGLNWQAIADRLRWFAEGFNRYNHRQSFELRQLQESSTTATALLAELPELYAFLRFRTSSLTGFPITHVLSAPLQTGGEYR